MNRTKTPSLTFVATATFLVGALLWSALAFVSMQPARAQQTAVTGLVQLGYCQLATLTASVGLASCAGGIPAGANAVVMRVDTQAARYRADGTAPTAAIGMPMLVADPPVFYRAGFLSALRFIEVTAGAKLNVVFYQAPQ